MNQNQATDTFLYGRILPKVKSPISDRQMETYQLVKVRFSGGKTLGESITEVAKILGENRSAVQSRVKCIQDRGWL